VKKVKKSKRLKKKSDKKKKKGYKIFGGGGRQTFRARLVLLKGGGCFPRGGNRGGPGDSHIFKKTGGGKDLKKGERARLPFVRFRFFGGLALGGAGKKKKTTCLGGGKRGGGDWGGRKTGFEFFL